MKIITTGSDFSGVGAFDFAIERVATSKGFTHKRIYACDWDKYARITYAHNHGMPDYYPNDVYEREIPKESLDIFMTSPPCQAFSLAGNRKGEDDERGVLFYNSHEFIMKNKPRFFIFENVKGLLSDENGRTFQTWIDYLGGKSVNGMQTMFPDENSAPYHVYHKVMNSKSHGVPQNRERIFIVGIRDDEDNNFRFPKEEPLTTRLKDVLESDVDEKYFLSYEMIQKLVDDNFDTDHLDVEINDFSKTLRCGGGNSLSKKHSYDVIKVKSATKKGYETATENDSINLEFPDSKTRRGRVRKGVAQTLDTGCNQGVVIGAIRGRNSDNPKLRISGLETTQMLEINENGTSNCLTTVQKDNVVVEYQGVAIIDDIYNNRDERIYTEFSPTIRSERQGLKVNDTYRIRKLTPRECFRLQDFPESFDFSVVSNSQAYKQAGNSITVRVLEKIINNLNL